MIFRQVRRRIRKRGTGQFGVAEGVVCKGESDGKVWMAKIKTNAYMQRLKEAFADKWEDYWE